MPPPYSGLRFARAGSVPGSTGGGAPSRGPAEARPARWRMTIPTDWTRPHRRLIAMQQLTHSSVGGHPGRLARLAALLALLIAILAAPQSTAAAGWEARALTALAGAPVHAGEQPH